MKRLIILFFISIYAFASTAQEADKITGVWWNEEKTTKIEVKKENGKYVGTIVYMIPKKYKNGEAPKDVNNPDEKLR